jgi:hypothetical protein
MLMAASTATAVPCAAEEAAVFLVSIAICKAWDVKARAGELRQTVPTPQYFICPGGR